jgi:hypothetical protein
MRRGTEGMTDEPRFCPTCRRETPHEAVTAGPDWGCGWVLFGLLTLGLYWLFARFTGSSLGGSRCRVCGTSS